MITIIINIIIIILFFFFYTIAFLLSMLMVYFYLKSLVYTNRSNAQTLGLGQTRQFTVTHLDIVLRSQKKNISNTEAGLLSSLSLQ